MGAARPLSIVAWPAGPRFGSRLRVPPGALGTASIATCALAIWELLARTALNGTYVIAAPSSIAATTADEWDLYLRNVRYTGWNALQAYIVGNAIAVVLAAITLLLPWSRRIVTSVALTATCVPLVALAPIMRVVLGRAQDTAVALGAIAVIYSTFVAAVLGLQAASPSSLDLVRSYGRGRAYALWKVRLPSATPALFAGLQIAAPAAFLGALLGEFTGSSRGLGVLTIQALGQLDTERVWAVAVVSTLVSVGAYVLIGRIGRTIAPWSPENDSSTVSSDVAPRHRFVRGVAHSAIAMIVVLVLWVLVIHAFGVNHFYAKEPDDVWRYLATQPSAGEHRAELFSALGETIVSAALGFAAGLTVALALAALFATVQSVRRVLLPVAIALRSVPVVATTPIMILLLGRGLVATVVIVAATSFFPTLVACASAMDRVPAQVLDVLRTNNASVLATIWRARLPTAIPALLASARIAVPASLLGATVTEWLATGRGIGNLMTVAAATIRYDTLWSCVVVLTLTAVVAHAAISLLERAVLARMAPGGLS